MADFTGPTTLTMDGIAMGHFEYAMQGQTIVYVAQRQHNGKCPRLPEPRLLYAAHIVMDADEQLGQLIVSNGLPLTKIHHAAFDAHLIGVDPDYRIHVSDRLLEIHDGPFLELGLKGIAGTSIQLPRRSMDRPDRDRLARRFEQFKKAA